MTYTMNRSVEIA